MHNNSCSFPDNADASAVSSRSETKPWMELLNTIILFIYLFFFYIFNIFLKY